jgi:carnosine N-methyltransferase
MIADPVFADMLAESQGNSHIADGHNHGHSHSHSHSHSHGHQGSTQASPSDTKPSQSEVDLSQDKVRSTIRSFVRDWSVEGEGERQACYGPCLEALERHYPGEGASDRNGIKVLVPGSGLGRLAMEVAARGEFNLFWWDSGPTSSFSFHYSTHHPLHYPAIPCYEYVPI